MGRAGSLVHVFPGPAELRDVQFQPPRGLTRFTGTAGWRDQASRSLAIHRTPDRGGRHAGGRGVHAVPHGKKSDVEPGARFIRSTPRRSAHGVGGAHRALHGIENSAVAGRRHVPADDRSVRLHFRERGGGRGGGGRHGDRRILLRDRLRKPGRHDRIVQQSDLRTHALDTHHRRADRWSPWACCSGVNGTSRWCWASPRWCSSLPR